MGQGNHTSAVDMVTVQILNSSSYSENFLEIELKIIKLGPFKDFIAVFLKTRKCGEWVVSPERVTYSGRGIDFILSWS